MSLIVNRIAGVARKVIENGIAYLVAPITMIRSGVLSGSKGPLFYPEDQLRKSVKTWNGTMLTAGHPSFLGESVSATKNGIWDRIGLGVVRNAQYLPASKKLVADGWFDIEKTKRVDPRIIQALENREIIEVSTGVITDSDEIPTALQDDFGTVYNRIVTRLSGDHLAILMDDRPACGSKMGCGVNVSNHVSILLPEEVSDFMNELLQNVCQCDDILETPTIDYVDHHAWNRRINEVAIDRIEQERAATNADEELLLLNTESVEREEYDNMRRLMARAGRATA